MRSRLLVPFLVVVLAQVSFPGTGAAAESSGSCSREAAKAVVRAHPHLHPWAPYWLRLGPVLCGPFLGDGREAMVVSFAAATCGGTSGWAVFRHRAGEWRLFWRQRDGQVGLARVGDEIEETVKVLNPGDPRCVPTGGTKSRRWRWNGARLVSTRWEYRVVNPADFLSPDRRTWCVIGEGVASCLAGGLSSTPRPEFNAYLHRGGGVTTCSVAVPSLEEHCFQNWYPAGPILEYGQVSEVEGIRCASAPDGITCTRIEPPGEGNGFRISGDEVVVLG